MWLASEVMFFAALFAVYFTLRSTAPHLWTEATPHLNVWLSLVNTIILVSSSVTCQFGVFAAERLQPRRVGGRWGSTEWFLLSYALGSIFIAGQVVEYSELVGEGLNPTTNAYWSAFFVATGFHAMHVIGGLLAFLVIVGRTYATRRFGHREAQASIVVSYYWHFVDVVWIALFAAIYLIQ